MHISDRQQRQTTGAANTSTNGEFSPPGQQLGAPRAQDRRKACPSHELRLVIVVELVEAHHHELQRTSVKVSLMALSMECQAYCDQDQDFTSQLGSAER